MRNSFSDGNSVWFGKCGSAHGRSRRKVSPPTRRTRAKVYSAPYSQLVENIFMKKPRGNPRATGPDAGSAREWRSAGFQFRHHAWFYRPELASNSETRWEGTMQRCESRWMDKIRKLRVRILLCDLDERILEPWRAIRWGDGDRKDRRSPPTQEPKGVMLNEMKSAISRSSLRLEAQHR